jgi:transcriptional regulator with XRE-family HTH domain
MISEQEKIRLIFGFKVKYLRQQKDLSYQQLADLTGMSLSYLSDIEKGKKYPKIDKINSLASAFSVDYDYLVSKKATKQLQPIIDLFESEIFNIFPLESFGINPGKLSELFMNAPDKVNAFISTFLKISRNYELKNDIFYKNALRSYQDLFNNYFKDLEEQVKRFTASYNFNTEIAFKTYALERCLRNNFNISIDREKLMNYPELRDKRSYFKPSAQTLYLNSGLSPAQENFLIGRELAFQFLDLKDRHYMTRPIEAESFEKLLNNFKASYFSAALLIPEQKIIDDISRISDMPNWNNNNILELLLKYDVTPEMLMQRLTNILPEHFNIKDLFFIRMTGDETLKSFKMTKELHLSKLHSPYANVYKEHYCRKWLTIKSIMEIQNHQRFKNTDQVFASAQISKYWETDNEYLCLTMAKRHNSNSHQISSVTVGLLITEKLRKVIRFLSDPQVETNIVNNTCERCSMPDCKARAFPAVIIEEKERKEEIRIAADQL